MLPPPSWRRAPGGARHGGLTSRTMLAVAFAVLVATAAGLLWLVVSSFGPDKDDKSLFEGREKTLVVWSGPPPKGSRYTKGLRFPPAKWTDILDSADCRVLSVMSNSDVDVYLLAESSLIVYKDRVMLKTCGGTTPLLALPQMFREYKNALLPIPSPSLQSIMYQRKTLRWPTDQHWPHRTLREENLFVSGFERIFGCKNWQRRVAGIPCAEANSVEQVVLDRADGESSGRVVLASNEQPPVFSESSPASITLLAAGAGASPAARAVMSSEAVSAAMSAARDASLDAADTPRPAANASASGGVQQHHLDGRDNTGQWVELWMDSIGAADAAPPSDSTSGQPASSEKQGLDSTLPDLVCMFCEECGGSGLNMTRSSGLGDYLQILKAKQSLVEQKEMAAAKGSSSSSSSAGKDLEEEWQAKKQRIDAGFKLQQHAFDTCGYSMNAVFEGGHYVIVHVTPQQNSQYVSIEFSLPWAMKHMQKAVAPLLSIFRPKRFALSVNTPVTTAADQVGLPLTIPEYSREWVGTSELSQVGRRVALSQWVQAA